MALGNVFVLLAVCPFPLSAKKLHLREIKPGFVGIVRSCFNTDDLIVPSITFDQVATETTRHVETLICSARTIVIKWLMTGN